MSRFFCYKDSYGYDQIFERHKGRGEMSFSIEAVVQNPCLLAPPPLPPSEFLGPEVIKQLYDYRNTFSAWRTYVDECTNDTGIYTAELTSTIISQPTTSESNVTTPSTGNILTNIISTSTKFPVSPQPIKPQTSPLTDNATVIGIVIGVLVLLLVVLVVVIIYKFRPTVWKKICGQSTNRRYYNVLIRLRSRRDMEDSRASNISDQYKNGTYTPSTAAEQLHNGSKISVSGSDSSCRDRAESTSDMKQYNNTLQDSDVKISIPDDSRTDLKMVQSGEIYRKGGTLSQEPLLDSMEADEVDGSYNAGFDTSVKTRSDEVGKVTDKETVSFEVQSGAIYRKGGTLSQERLIDSMEGDEVHGSYNTGFNGSNRKEGESCKNEKAVSVETENGVNENKATFEAENINDKEILSDEVENPTEGQEVSVEVENDTVKETVAIEADTSIPYHDHEM